MPITRRYSPTVAPWYHQTKNETINWFQLNGGGKLRGNNPSSHLDNDGFDRYGYNDDGVDRHQHSRDYYNHNQQYYCEVFYQWADIPLPHRPPTIDIGAKNMLHALYDTSLQQSLNDSDNQIVQYRDQRNTYTLQSVNIGTRDITVTKDGQLMIIPTSQLKKMPASNLHTFVKTTAD